MREVVPGKSNNEISLVLQHYDNNVELAIQAYLEGEQSIIVSWNLVKMGAFNWKVPILIALLCKVLKIRSFSRPKWVRISTWACQILILWDENAKYKG